MRLRGVNMTLEGADGEKSPPLPFIEVAEGEGEVLLALYPKRPRGSYVELVDEDGQVVEPAAEDLDPLAGPEAEQPAPADTPDGTEGSDTVEGGAGGDTVEGGNAPDSVTGTEGSDTVEGGEGTGPHAEDLTDAFELLGDDDLVKTGDRAGRPKVNVVKEILDRDVTAEEIDAAWAAREPAAA